MSAHRQPDKCGWYLFRYARSIRTADHALFSVPALSLTAPLYMIASPSACLRRLHELCERCIGLAADLLMNGVTHRHVNRSPYISELLPYVGCRVNHSGFSDIQTQKPRRVTLD
jgi:hypothetical protein